MPPLINSDTTSLSYWWNWRVLLCAIWVLTSVVVGVFIIWKYEDLGQLRLERRKNGQETVQSLHDNEAWRPCVKQIHPLWLLAYRLIVFSLLLATLVIKVSHSGFGMFLYYTQWTFTFLTIYFGFGSLLSIYGCYQYKKMGNMHSDSPYSGRNVEKEYHVPLMCEDRTEIPKLRKLSNPQDKTCVLQPARVLYNVFQVIFQMNAGAVMFTDCVYWSIIFPFLTIKDYDLNFMTVDLHAFNAIFLLGDTALNCLPFPWFRIAYFILWTDVFVIFQWIVHAFISIWWPYPFLDLASVYAPLWYLLMAAMHIPCYGIFVLFVKMKHDFLSKWFPGSCQCSR